MCRPPNNNDMYRRAASRAHEELQHKSQTQQPYPSPSPTQPLLSPGVRSTAEATTKKAPETSVISTVDATQAEQKSKANRPSMASLDLPTLQVMRIMRQHCSFIRFDFTRPYIDTCTDTHTHTHTHTRICMHTGTQKQILPSRCWSFARSRCVCNLLNVQKYYVSSYPHNIIGHLQA